MFHLCYTRRNPAHSENCFCSLSLSSLWIISSLLRSNLSLASTLQWKLSDSSPLSHSLLFCPAWSALRAGIHVAQRLGCHYLALSRWPTVEWGWAHLHRWVWVEQKNVLSRFISASFITGNSNHRKWTSGRMLLWYLLLFSNWTLSCLYAACVQFMCLGQWCGQGLNVAFIVFLCLHKTDKQRDRERFLGMKPLCDSVDWYIAQLGPILLITIATRASVVHIGCLKILF